MKMNRKELTSNALKSIKTHYFIFVVTLIFVSLIGITYNSATYFFSALKGEQAAMVDKAAKEINESGLIPEKVSIDETIDSLDYTAYDTSNDIVNQMFRIATGGKDAVNTIQNQANDLADQADEKVGVITFGYQKGVLASLVNNVKSSSILLSIFNAVTKVVKDPSVTSVIFLIAGVGILFLYRTFFKNALWITTKRLFLEAQTYDKSTVRPLAYLFRTRSYIRACFTLFVQKLCLVLWSLTIVGGIIKFFSYALVPYILAENPGLNSKEAITLSRKMMNGHKWEMFLLYLSFIGWEILNLVTAGLLGMFFLNPYIEATFAQYYLRLRKEAIENKVEGYELLIDDFLVKKATSEDLAPLYSDFEELAKNEPKEIEKYTGVLGFFANILGVVPYYTEKAKRINEQDEKLMRLESYSLIKEGRVYPERLHPMSSYHKKKKTFKSSNFMRRYSIISLVSIFFIGSFIGWVWEVSLHIVEDGVFVNRGVMHGPWLPIYGTGAALILIVLYKARKWPWLEFLLTIVVCGIVEYFTSWYLEVTQNGTKWWDYTGYFLNINGRVCAEGLLVFGIAGIICVYLVAPLIDNFIQRINIKILLPILIAVLIVFTADNIYSKSHPNTGAGITDYNQSAPTQN